MIDYLGDDSEYKTAIVDTAVQYGLVTDHTSMIVVRDEVFAERNIARNNQARRNVEVTAAQQRATQPVQNTRADQSQPAFNSPRPSHSSGGGGTFGIELFILTLLSLSIVGWCKRKS